jgi:hypothetical protein
LLIVVVDVLFFFFDVCACACVWSFGVQWASHALICFSLYTGVLLRNIRKVSSVMKSDVLFFTTTCFFFVLMCVAICYITFSINCAVLLHNYILNGKCAHT